MKGETGGGGEVTREMVFEQSPKSSNVVNSGESSPCIGIIVCTGPEEETVFVKNRAWPL